MKGIFKTASKLCGLALLCAMVSTGAAAATLEIDDILSTDETSFYSVGQVLCDDVKQPGTCTTPPPQPGFVLLYEPDDSFATQIAEVSIEVTGVESDPGRITAADLIITMVAGASLFPDSAICIVTGLPDDNCISSFSAVGDTYTASFTVFAGQGNELSSMKVNLVPVPAAAWLFGSALLGLGVIKRKRA